MAKIKEPKGPKRVPNKHLHARVSYLYQAASYLSLQDPPDHQCQETKKSENATSSQLDDTSESLISPFKTSQENGADQIERTSQTTTQRSPQSGLALLLGSQLRAVSRKSQIRLSQDIKRSLCKSCDAILVPGRNSTSRVENKSRNERKPWADVLLIECQTCGTLKRFPVGSKCQARKADRHIVRPDMLQ